MSGHIPGPWKWLNPDQEEDGHQCRLLAGEAGNGYLVVRHRARWPVSDADARLIAAAPMLLEALRPFANLAVYGDLVENMSLTLRAHEREGFRRGFEEARAAIAAATEGGAQ